MTIRLAAACLLVLPLCSDALASPLGVLTAPFASKVLVQQRDEAARDNRAPAAAGQTRAEACQASVESGAQIGRTERAEDKPPRCDITDGNTVADRNAVSENTLPDSDKKRNAE